MVYEPTKADWDAVWSHAGQLKLAMGSGTTATGIKGRWITALVNKLCEFWERHKDTLIPFLSQFAIAALEAVIQARTSINTVNNPGPR